MTDKEKLQTSEDENADLRLEIVALKKEIVALKDEVRCVRKNQQMLLEGLENIESVLAASQKAEKRRFRLRG